MKSFKTKMILTISAFVLLFLNGCSKQSETTEQKQSEEYYTKLSIYKNETSSSAKKSLYRLFTGNEKMKFWKEHFEIALKNENIRDNVQKISLINELSYSLNEMVFTVNSKEKDIFLSYKIPVWLKKAESVFSAEEIAELILFSSHDSTSNLNPENQKKVNLVGDMEAPAEGPVDCFCHVGNSGYSCKQLQVGIPSGVSITYGMCEEASKDCSSSKYGCGALWLESCNGSHCNY